MNKKLFKISALLFCCLLSFFTYFGFIQTTNNIMALSAEQTFKKTVSNIYILRKPFYSQEYFRGEDINLRGLQIRVWYDDLTRETVDYNDRRVELEGFDSNVTGEQFVKVYFVHDGYSHYVDTITVNILNEEYIKLRGTPDTEIEDLENRKAPDITSYLVDDIINLDGMEFVAYYDDGRQEFIKYTSGDVSGDLAITTNASSSSKAGVKKITATVTYKGFHENYDFNVVFKNSIDEKVPVKIQPVIYPETIDDLTNATFQVEYDDGTTEIMSYDATILKSQKNFLYPYVTVYFSSDKNVKCTIWKTWLIDESNSINKNYNLHENKGNNSYYERKTLYQSLYDISGENLPVEYDLRISGDIEIDIENQGGDNLCWDFAATKCLETNFLMKNGIKYDLSERFTDFITSNVYYGNRDPRGAGNFYRYCNQIEKTGVPLEELLPYDDNYDTVPDNLDDIEKVISLDSVVKFPSFFNIESNRIVRDNLIKAHIMQNGSVSAGFEYSRDLLKDEDATYFYVRGLPISNLGHEASIIGWDDNYSKENFIRYDSFGNEVKPKNNGAWIALNSWGDDWGIDGCFYISYESEEMDYFGVLESSVYEQKNEYSYTENKPYVNNESKKTIENKRYLYVEFDTSGDNEYLTNFILDIEGICDIYLIHDYEDEINFDNRQFLCSYESPSYLIGNCVLETPIKLSGDKFTLLFEYEREEQETTKKYFPTESGSIHTFYTENTDYTGWEEYDGDIYLNAYTKTITPEEPEEPVILGDINNDKSKTIVDVRLLLQAVINSSFTESDYPIMDMNIDGVINIVDVRLLLQDIINQ